MGICNLVFPVGPCTGTLQPQFNATIDLWINTDVVIVLCSCSHRFPCEAGMVSQRSSNMLLAFAGLSEVLRKHTYVGMADETLALLQHGTRLYLFNLASLSKDMFYQQVLAANAGSTCSQQGLLQLS